MHSVNTKTFAFKERYFSPQMDTDHSVGADYSYAKYTCHEYFGMDLEAVWQVVE